MYALVERLNGSLTQYEQSHKMLHLVHNGSVSTRFVYFPEFEVPMSNQSTFLNRLDLMFGWVQVELIRCLFRMISQHPIVRVQHEHCVLILLLGQTEALLSDSSLWCVRSIVQYSYQVSTTHPHTVVHVLFDKCCLTFFIYHLKLT